MTLVEVAQVVGLATNFSIIIGAVKVVRYISQIEYKVNTMWTVFMRTFGERGIDTHDHS